ncbi:unnamed protein product [Microthlaspi erraticum]|uniref:Reverse transcriptase Ty1/copia-type domain-containing protein n=1 Tax=Microthlaspi erraticum TaxID=1685480 RepID=A0A6D2J7C1_9BRAS|nr:unnamed protein product [Microthlaspi erraticum]
MSTEIDAFALNHTFDLVLCQAHFNVVGCRWIYTNKFLSSGEHNRCKARLVSKGYNQKEGQDYIETFIPVIKATMIHIVLDFSVSQSWPLLQLDVNNAFLQGTLTYEVYMEEPPGFVDADHPSYVCRLNKAVYGLKQAPRSWYNELSTFLLSLGIINSLVDPSLFMLRSVPPKELGGKVVVWRGQTTVRDTPLDWVRLTRSSLRFLFFLFFLFFTEAVIGSPESLREVLVGCWIVLESGVII